MPKAPKARGSERCVERATAADARIHRTDSVCAQRRGHQEQSLASGCAFGDWRRSQHACVAGSGTPLPAKPYSSEQGGRGLYLQAALTVRGRRQSHHRREAAQELWSSHIHIRRTDASLVAGLTKRRLSLCDVVLQCMAGLALPWEQRRLGDCRPWHSDTKEICRMQRNSRTSDHVSSKEASNTIHHQRSGNRISLWAKETFRAGGHVPVRREPPW